MGNEGESPENLRKKDRYLLDGRRQIGCLLSDASYGICRSTDGGSSWTLLNPSLDWHYLSAIVSDSSGNLYAASLADGVYKKTNEGDSWTRTALTDGVDAVMLLFDGRLCVAGRAVAFVQTTFLDLAGKISQGDGVSHFDTSSSQWIQCGIYLAVVTSFYFERAGEIFLGTQDGVFRPSPPGKGWIRAAAVCRAAHSTR